MTFITNISEILRMPGKPLRRGTLLLHEAQTFSVVPFSLCLLCFHHIQIFKIIQLKLWLNDLVISTFQFKMQMSLYTTHAKPASQPGESNHPQSPAGQPGESNHPQSLVPTTAIMEDKVVPTAAVRLAAPRTRIHYSRVLPSC